MPIKTQGLESIRPRFAPPAQEKGPPDLKPKRTPSGIILMRFELPMPPSANRYWRLGEDGKLHRSAEAKDFKADVEKALREKNLTAITGDVRVSIDVFRAIKSGDLDNRLKVTLDSLQGICYADDSQIISINARRFDDPDRPRVEVEVSGEVRCE